MIEPTLEDIKAYDDWIAENGMSNNAGAIQIMEIYVPGQPVGSKIYQPMRTLSGPHTYIWGIGIIREKGFKTTMHYFRREEDGSYVPT